MITIKPFIKFISLTLAMLCLMTWALPATEALAQEPLPPPPPPINTSQTPLDSNLVGIEQSVGRQALTGQTLEQLNQQLEAQGMLGDARGRIRVEIAGPEGGGAVPPNLITSVGGEIVNIWNNYTDAWVPVQQLTNLARVLPADYFIKPVGPANSDQSPVIGEGSGATGSDQYRDNGANCAGRTIAVIDGGFSGLGAARTNGDAPTTNNTTAIDYSNGGSIEEGDVHGTGVVEALFDHCPGAAWRLYRINTAVSQLGNAITDARNNGVDIISMSLSWYGANAQNGTQNNIWPDDAGGVCAAVNGAARDDILFFTSAGNRAQSHWQGNFSSPDNDRWHEWVNGDEAIKIQVPPNIGGNYYLSWNTAGGVYDYDLYLYDSTLTTVLARSTNTGNQYESLFYKNTSPNTQTVNLAVWRKSGQTTQFEVFSHNAGVWQEHAMAASSTTSPSNCTDLNVISVGAVDEDNYAAAPGANNIESYSSQGPSNSGMTLPDLVGPTDTTGFTYPNGFGGTSAATPNAAGTTAAFWSGTPLLFSIGVRHLVFEQAKIFKDWGTGGSDNIYGVGGVFLHTWHNDTIWVDRRVGNTNGTPGLPYYYVADAQSAAASGGRIVFLGQHYPERINLDKRLLYETIGWPARLGD